MQDDEIVELYWQRDEQAIRETDAVYGAYLLKIAGNILNDEGDSQEVVNDTYFKAWCTMPENRPRYLSLYLAKIARQTAIDIWRSRHRDKRKALEYAVSLEELTDVVSGAETPEELAEAAALRESIEAFLKTLAPEARTAFVGRYYYADSVKDIAGYLWVSESKVKNLLFSVRKKLKEWLKTEGFTV
jgi:RNA polymerase sigma-70 factor (ECF subfamily)